jgi:hypothetical protein
MGIQAIGSSAAVDLTAMTQLKMSGANKSAGQTGQAGAPKAEGAPPAGGGGGVQPAASSESTSSASSSAKIYDKRDADQDGVVSYQEELMYGLEHPGDDKSTLSASQMQTGLNAYQQGQQANSTSSSSLLFDI